MKKAKLMRPAQRMREPEPAPEPRKAAPLTSSFAVTAILGIFISLFFVWQVSPTWGFTFLLFFVAMAIAAFVSMLRADPDPQLRP
jgi:hypothetical protein